MKKIYKKSNAIPGGIKRLNSKVQSLLVAIGLLLGTLSVSAQDVVITETVGWLETAFVKWTPVDGAESYNVYVTGEGLTDSKLDDQLIRSYGSYYRADALGLAAGSYTLKVAPVVSGVEGTATESTSVTVMAHDRTGFAFANSRVPGAYKADGTLKDGAVVLYITENTKNTISVNVTGATENPCVGLQTILEGFKKGKDTRPLAVRFVGQITDLSYMLNGDIVVENNNNASSHITLEGIGDDTTIDGFGIRVKNASNIEIRNLGTMNCNSGEGDNVGLQQNNDYIWVHNCDFFYGDAGSDSDQAKGDGALDCKKSTYVTFSYNHFWDSGKCNLLGLSEGTTTGLYITYHHNWYDHSDSRHPRVRFYSAHVYNNYYDGNSKYGVGSTKGSSVFVENNYFRHCKYPILTSMQGSDVYDEDIQANEYSDMPTFSKEDGGTIKAFNNHIEDARRFVAYGSADYNNSSVDFDAVVVSTRTETVSSDIKSVYGSNTYNNFDTNSSIMYSCTPDTPEEAKANVMLYAGRVQGGDFQWTFDNDIDDTSYAVNSALKSSLSSYETTMVSIQGDGTTTVDDGSGDTGSGDAGSGDGGSTDTGSGEIIEGDMVHLFEDSGKSSTFYNITGNLTTKTTATYGGRTLETSLKIESSTSITFTTTEKGTYTLVFAPENTGSIIIDDVDYYLSEITSSGSYKLFSLSLEAGSHTFVRKSTESHLFYMSMVYDEVEDDTALGIDDAEYQAPVFYPNPVVTQLNIDTDESIVDVTIYTMSGSMVQRFTSVANTINMAQLPKGSYVVVVRTEQNVYKQIVLKK